ncbi:MAG: type I DNA topoisomerase [Elusimicrobia bacterium]|nr:type I DNA topoisomerase [Elusimicrobiota bacterium]
MPSAKPKTTKKKTVVAAETPEGEAAAPAEVKPAKAKAKKAAKPVAAKSKGGDGAALVIVESPAKQRTISRILSSGFVVRSSYGHVRDLPENKLGVNDKKDFEPSYVLLPRTKKILPELQKLAEKASQVFLATDHDREGESIAWHLVHILELSDEKARRITFHEITPSAIQEAIRAPRSIDVNLVHAQQARRVIDRLVGYKLSPLLWKKVRRGLSAGRVQSVAVRFLVERDKEMQAFQSAPYWTLAAMLEKPGAPPPFEARLTLWKGEKVEAVQVHELFSETYRVRSTSFKSREEIEVVTNALSAAAFKITAVDRKEQKRRPAPPFTTSTLQQAASQKHGMAADRTMRIAQNLYEGVDIGGGEPVGLITYMRTDSVSVAQVAQEAARKLITEKFGKAFAPAEAPVYKTKSKGAQEAHEAIRPTDVARLPEDMKQFLDPDQAKIYELIWRRFTASQMSEAVYDTVAADLQAGDAQFRANGRTLKFEGFLKAYQIASTQSKPEDEEIEAEKDDEPKEGILPELSVGDVLKLAEMKPEEHQTSPPPHYNEASLIRALEKHGIGRPSTSAPTVKTIIDRGYVKKGLKDRTLTPSELGTLVTEKLKEHFPDVVNLTYTAEVEERLDHIAEGDERWQNVVQNFYEPFQKALSTAMTVMEDTKPIPTDEKCPLCQSMMLIRESRFGKYLSCSKFPQCKGKVRLTESGEKIVPQFTDEKCEVCGKLMCIRMGRRGKFLACSGYPACKNTYSLDENGKKIEGSRPIATSRKCEKCSSMMWLRLGKRGFFIACSGFPKCRNLKPVSKDEAAKLKAEADAKPKAEAESKPGSPAS